MNFIEKRANRTVLFCLSDRNLWDAKELLKMVKDDLRDVDSEEDKLRYISIVLEANDKEDRNHKKECKADPNVCEISLAHDEVNYFLQQELIRMNVLMSANSFSSEEKETLISQLDKIVADLKNLKDGQQIIYDDLFAEIEELKNWFIVGKKNWKDMAIGKVGEMVASGVISELTAKPLIATIKSGIQLLLA